METIAEYRTDLFDAATMGRMLGHSAQVLEEIPGIASLVQRRLEQGGCDLEPQVRVGSQREQRSRVGVRDHRFQAPDGL